MLAYIPSPAHDSLFDDYCNQNGIPITKKKVKRLLSFVESSYSNLSHVTVLAVDISAVSDTDDEILSALLTFGVMYPEKRIIVIVAERKPDDPLVGWLTGEGITNIITGKPTEKDIIRCMTEQETQRGADFIFAQEPDILYDAEPEPEAQAAADKPKPPPAPVLSEKRPEAKPSPGRGERYGIRLPKITLPRHTPPVPRRAPDLSHHYEIEPIPQSHARYIKPSGRAVNIGVFGTHRKIGTTHLSVLLCAYLSGVGFRAAYLESNTHKSVDQLDRVHNVSSNRQLGLRQHRGVDLFTGYSVPLVMALKYDFYVYDYGTYQEVEVKEFLSNDIKIVVGGSKPWELPFYLPFFRAVDGFADLHFILNFTPEKERDNIRRLMGKYAATTYLSGYDPDPFECGACGEMFENILHEQIESEVDYV